MVGPKVPVQERDERIGLERVTRKGANGRGLSRFFLTLLLLGMPVFAKPGLAFGR